MQKWPSLRLDAAGKPLEKQSRIVLLLCAAFGFNEPEDMEQPEVDLVNAALDFPFPTLISVKVNLHICPTLI